MENPRRASKKKNDTVGWVKQNGICKKHPKHSQSPGVCSVCLNEKLIQLTSFSLCRRTSHDSSTSSSVSSLSSSYYSSSSVSSCASPVHCFCFITTEEKSSTNSLSINLLGKSKSLKDGEDGDEHGHKTENKGGFLFKLLRPKSKRLEEEDQKDTKDKLVRSMSIPRETINVAS